MTRDTVAFDSWGRLLLGIVLAWGLTAAAAVADQTDDEVARLYEQGKRAYQDGRFFEATRAFERALALSRQQAASPNDQPHAARPDDPAIPKHLKRGKTLYRHHDYAGAVNEFERAFRLDPTNAKTAKWLTRAREALVRQDVQEQLKMSREAERRWEARRKQAEKLERKAREAHERLTQQTRSQQLEGREIRPGIREYLINIGDVIDVFVWQQRDLTRRMIVRPDGRVSFPLIGDIDAAGMTLVQLDDTMTERLKTYIRFPDVSLAIQRFGGTKTIVLGEVSRQGVFVPAGKGRVLEVLAMAGGFKKNAAKKSVMLIRGGLTNPQITKLNLEKALRTGALEYNVLLKPNDIVYVPKGGIVPKLEFIEEFFPMISEILVGNSIAADYGVRETSGGVTR